VNQTLPRISVHFERCSSAMYQLFWFVGWAYFRVICDPLQ